MIQITHVGSRRAAFRVLTLLYSWKPSIHIEITADKMMAITRPVGNRIFEMLAVH